MSAPTQVKIAIAVIAAAVLVVGFGIGTNVKRRAAAERACMRAGYPETKRVLGSGEYFCVGRFDGTDRVVPVAEIER